MRTHNAVEMANTVLEVADLAWTAVEYHHHHHRHRDPAVTHDDNQSCPSDQDFEALQLENRRLRNLLDQNLKLLNNLSESNSFLSSCPPDVYIQIPYSFYFYNFLFFLLKIDE